MVCSCNPRSSAFVKIHLKRPGRNNTKQDPTNRPIIHQAWPLTICIFLHFISQYPLLWVVCLSPWFVCSVTVTTCDTALKHQNKIVYLFTNCWSLPETMSNLSDETAPLNPFTTSTVLILKKMKKEETQRRVWFHMARAKDQHPTLVRR